MITINPQISVEYIVYDFAAKVNPNDYLESFSKVFTEKDISILVNNVGLGSDDFFENITHEEVFKIVHVNTIPITLLTKIALPIMKKRITRSAIINLGSSSAIFPMSGYTVYSASKAFDGYLSVSLVEEYKKKIDIFCLKPFQVDTNLSKLKKGSGFFIIDKNECASAALDRLGYEIEAYGHWKHELEGAIVERLPQWFVNKKTRERMTQKQMKAKRS